MGTLVEGLEATQQACTLVILLPALGLMLLAGRRSPSTLAGFVVGAATLAWAQAGGHWSVEGRGVAVLAGALVYAGAGLLLARTPGPLRGFESLNGMAAGAVIGWLWRPCAGPHLATILNDASGAPARTFWLMIVYVVGVTTPAIFLAALPVAFPQLSAGRDHRATILTGAAVTSTFAVLMAVGLSDELVAELVRRSTS